MAFCSECGTKLQEGDIFCASCGARIQGGNTGSEPGTQPQGFQQSAAALSSINTEAISRHSRQTLDVILGMLIRPMSTIKNLLHTLDQKSTLIIGAVLALFQGIFSLWKLGQVISSMDKMLISLMKSMSSVMGMVEGGSSGLNPSDFAEITAGYGQLRKIISVPYGKAFLHGIILYLIVAGLAFLGIYVASKLSSKANVNVLNIGKLAILSTIPALGGEVISIIFSYIYSPLGMFVLLAGILVSFAVLIMNIKEVVEIEDDKLVFAASIVLSILVVCSLFAIYKFVLSDIKSIENSIVENAAKLYK